MSISSASGGRYAADHWRGHGLARRQVCVAIGGEARTAGMRRPWLGGRVQLGWVRLRSMSDVAWRGGVEAWRGGAAFDGMARWAS